MEIKLYNDKHINELGTEYVKDIKEALAPILYKSYKNKIKRSDFIRVLISTVLGYRLPSEFNNAILSMKKKKSQE